jgi:methionyl-tRNA formyltransferase
VGSPVFDEAMDELRIIFMGTPELARVSLAALIGCPRFAVVAVVTQPDRPQGRDLKLQASPVKQAALEHHLPVLQPERARHEAFLAELRAFNPDLICVAAYGQILPQSILDLPRFGCLNVHTSLLPKYRGAAPIQWAIANGDPETGVTIMKMDAGMDTGPMVAQETTRIEADDTSQILHDRLATIGAALLVRTIPDYVAARITPQPQPAVGASHAPRIRKEDGRIDWRLSASALRNRIRAFTPWPGAFTNLTGTATPRLLKIWETERSDMRGAPGEILRADKSGIVVATGEGALCILTLQLEGGRKLTARDFLAGHPLIPGSILG